MKAFREKPILQDISMNPGVYCMSDGIFDRLPDGKGSLEKKTFPELVALERVGYVEFPTPPYYWWSVKTENDLKVASEGFERFLRRPPQNAQPARLADGTARASHSVSRST